MIAWHYTIGERASAIMEEGIIRPAVKFVPRGEKPCVWFSTLQKWEPTANKAVIEQGNRRELTFEEMQQLPGGLWRFGLPVERLLCWRQLLSQTGMARKMATGLMRAGIELGSGPEFWYGSLQPVPVDDCLVECFRRGSWHRFLIDWGTGTFTVPTLEEGG